MATQRLLLNLLNSLIGVVRAEARPARSLLELELKVEAYVFPRNAENAEKCKRMRELWVASRRHTVSRRDVFRKEGTFLKHLQHKPDRKERNRRHSRKRQIQSWLDKCSQRLLVSV